MENTKKASGLAKICLMIALPIAYICFGVKFLGADFVPFLKWWFAIFVLGLVAFPLTSSFFRKFNDKGYLFSKVIGFALAGYVVWLMTCLKIMKFTGITCIIMTALCAAIIYGYYVVKAKITHTKCQIYEAYDLSLLSNYVFEELFFFGVFLLLIYIKGFKPEASGTEKFMDYGFMTVMYRSDYMPAEDLWFSGNIINYYYVGQYMATFLTKLSHVKISEGYNLAMMLIGGFTVTLPYSITVNLLQNVKTSDGKRRCAKIFPHIGGVISGVAVSFAGSMHYTYYKLVVPFMIKFLSLDVEVPGYWFPDATRYIGYQPDTNDKTIHEFPNYSLVLGDLHAHAINLMFVLALLGLLLAWQLRKNTKEKLVVSNAKNLFGQAFQTHLFMIAFLIGIFCMTNYWDFPIYFVVSGAIILFTNLYIYEKKKFGWLITAVQGIYMFGFAYFISILFTLNFDKISSNIRICPDHTPLKQMIVLWGLPIAVITGYIIFRYVAYQKGKQDEDKRDWSHVDRFVILIGLCAIGLVLVPEVVYVEDIYSEGYKRANTMFKLTFQAFMLMGIVMGYIFVRLIAFHNKAREKKFSIICFILFLTTVGYSVTATKSWFGNIFHPNGYKGLDCTAFLDETMPQDSEGIAWLNENVTGTPVVLEVNGLSYTDYERVSSFTGLPTLLGWRTHEWLWRGRTDILDERELDITDIYTSTNASHINELIDKYNISYIFVGQIEMTHFETIQHDILRSLGEVVFEGVPVEGQAYGTYIVKINR